MGKKSVSPVIFFHVKTSEDALSSEPFPSCFKIAGFSYFKLLILNGKLVNLHT